MPPVIAAAATAVGVWAGGSLAVAYIAYAAIYLGFTYGVNKLFAPKLPDARTSLRPISTMKRSGIEYRNLVYGRALVSGPVTYNNLSGNTGQYLWYAVALAHGENEDIEEVWFDQDKILKSEIGWTAGAGGADGTGDGAVTKAAWVGDNSATAVNIFYYAGHPDQVVCNALDTAFSVQIDTNYRGRDVAYLVVKLTYDQDTERVFKGGPPKDIKALVKGRKIYDPRLDSTQVIDDTTSPVTLGSGSHRLATSSTWAWSDNPALCTADYLTQIMSVPEGSIDWPSIANAADDCEVQVIVPPLASPSNFQDRFTCNGSLSLGSSHKDNLDSLISSCDGKLSYAGGKWKLRASVWEASSVSITENDLAGDVDVRGSAPRSERFNTIRGFFVDPDRKYESAEFRHVSSATYISRDAGQSISYDLRLPFTNNEYMAQRIATRVLHQGNNQIACTLSMNARGSKVEVGDVVSITIDYLSWSAKEFRCVEWSRKVDGTYQVSFREDSSGSYSDPALGEYLTGNAQDVTVPAEVVPAPTSLSAATASGGIALTWTNPPAAEYDYIDIYESASSAWGSASRIARIRADSYVVPKLNDTAAYFWVRAIRLPSTESARSPDSDTSTVSESATIPGGGAQGSAAVFVNQYIRQAGTPSTPGATSASYNFDTQTFTPTSSWSAGVPAVGSPTQPVWVSTAQFYAANSTGTDSSTTWSAPQKLAEDGIDGADGGTGAAGSDGAASIFLNQYIRNATQPATPGTTSASYNFDTTPGTFTPTSSWSAGVPAAGSPTLPVWASTAQFYSADGTGTDSNTTWTSPQKLAEDGADGATGADGVSTNLTNPSPVAPADNDGSNPVFTNTGGTHKVYEGATDVTTSATHSIVGGTTTKVQNSLTLTVVAGTGAYSFSGASWSTDQEQFTLRANYGGVNYDRLVTITKAKEGGAGGGAITAIGGDLQSVNSVNQEAKYKVDNDGDVYAGAGDDDYSNTVSVGTWLVTGSAGDYDVSLIKDSGTDPTTGGTLGTWYGAGTDREWSWLRSSTGFTTFRGVMRWRDATTYEILGQASIFVSIEKSA